MKPKNNRIIRFIISLNLLTASHSQTHAQLSPDTCALGEFYNVTCDKLARFDVYATRDFSKESAIKTKHDTLPGNFPYLIERKTHRLWLTSADSPQEVKQNRLEFYQQSLSLYPNESFEHHFWCNDLSLIPQTVAKLQSFTTPVILHEMKEISPDFIAKKLYEKFLQDKMFAFAGEIARQEILVHEGGLYTDIGMEQISDVDRYFKHYELLMCISFKWVDNHFIAAKKNSPFLTQALALVAQLPSTLAQANINLYGQQLHHLLTVGTWQLVAALTNQTFGPDSFLYEGIDFRVHGLGTWHSDLEKLTVNYLNAD